MQDFLHAIGAVIAADVRFADEPEALAALDQTTIIAPLAHYALLAVEGADSAKFLQGQTTCDVQEADNEHSVAGAHCTQKGRMLSNFQLGRRDEQALWLRMRRDIVESTRASLGKYIVFSKATLRTAEELIPIGVHGPAAAAAVRSLSGAAGGGRHCTARTEGGLIVQQDNAGQWFECWLPRAEALAFWEHNQTRLTPTGTRYWRWLNIRAGQGEICAATADQFIPQMLNLHITGAVNFKKGCYTGQEIVARTQYRGQIKRHMYRLAKQGAAPAAGSDLIMDNGHKLGTVVDSVALEAQSCELLAVLSAADADQLSSDSGTVRLLEVPYAIT